VNAGLREYVIFPSISTYAQLNGRSFGFLRPLALLPIPEIKLSPEFSFLKVEDKYFLVEQSASDEYLSGLYEI
jgi:hypothetical protein